MKEVTVKPISRIRSVMLVNRFHYSKVMPQLTKLYLGGFREGELIATMTLGWGVRPLHTIQKLFPSLGTEDYWTIGKLCVDDKEPQNSESMFISQCLDYVKQKFSRIKLIFTWADGMLGKPGYVYQASNFLYGGYIWTDVYFTADGEKVHPRLTNRLGGRPSYVELKKLGWEHYRGKQFRYIYFLCSHREKRGLLQESSFEWEISGPKDDELEWKRATDSGWEFTGPPDYDSDELSFRSPLPLLDHAGKVSRVET